MPPAKGRQYAFQYFPVIYPMLRKFNRGLLFSFFFTFGKSDTAFKILTVNTVQHETRLYFE